MSQYRAKHPARPASEPSILSCGVIVLRPAADGSWLYLLLRAFNYWDFPKGMREPGELPLATALREVREETTLTELDFRWGEVYRETPPYNHGCKVARYYIASVAAHAAVDLPISEELGRPEHSEYRWVTRQEAWGMLTPRVRAVLRWSDGIISVGHHPH